MARPSILTVAADFARTLLMCQAATGLCALLLHCGDPDFGLVPSGKMFSASASVACMAAAAAFVCVQLREDDRT